MRKLRTFALMTGTLGLLAACATSNGVKGRGETPVFLKHGALAGDFSRRGSP